MPKQPIEFVKEENGTIELTGYDFSLSERTERKSVSAQCGHVKRKLKRNEPLEGKVLEFALGVLAEQSEGFKDNGVAREVATKLRAGQQLNDYELHLMLDVFLLHKRLA